MDKLIENIKEIRKNPIKEFLSNYLLYLSAQRALETCINICIDIGNHILAKYQNGVAETYSEIFTRLSELGIIDEQLNEKLVKMAKFRNLLGHIYMDVDNEKIYDIINNNLEDFNEFKTKIYIKFKKELLNENSTQ